MNRREFVAAAASVGVLGAGAAVATERVNFDDPSGTATVEPIELETLDASGSDAGVTTVPDPGGVTLLSFFATWCRICADSMPALGQVYDEYGDDVRFLSISNEAIGGTVSRDDVVDWWERYDGRWTVGIDADLELTAEFDVATVPTTLILDADNDVAWRSTGEKTADDLRAGIDHALGDR